MKSRNVVDGQELRELSSIQHIDIFQFTLILWSSITSNGVDRLGLVTSKHFFSYSSLELPVRLNIYNGNYPLLFMLNDF